jgi:hypothetical protein
MSEEMGGVILGHKTMDRKLFYKSYFDAAAAWGVTNIMLGEVTGIRTGPAVDVRALTSMVSIC